MLFDLTSSEFCSTGLDSFKKVSPNQHVQGPAPGSEVRFLVYHSFLTFEFVRIPTFKTAPCMPKQYSLPKWNLYRTYTPEQTTQTKLFVPAITIRATAEYYYSRYPNLYKEQ
jgi:hypothetical protein